MGTPQEWAPYSSMDEAANVYLRDPELALDRLLPAIKSIIMSRGSTDQSRGEAVSQEVALDDGGLAQMQRLMQFGLALSRCIR
jgi:hypothetical protein